MPGLQRKDRSSLRLKGNYPPLHGLRQTIRHSRLLGRTRPGNLGHDLITVLQQGMSILSPLLSHGVTVWRIRDVYCNILGNCIWVREEYEHQRKYPSGH